MEKQIQEVISRLSETPTYEGILSIATEVSDNEVLTSETIRGTFQVWNDYFNGNEGLPVDSDSITKKVLKEWIGCFIDLDADYLTERVIDELEDQGRYTRP